MSINAKLFVSHDVKSVFLKEDDGEIIYEGDGDQAMKVASLIGPDFGKTEYLVTLAGRVSIENNVFFFTVVDPYLPDLSIMFKIQNGIEEVLYKWV